MKQQFKEREKNQSISMCLFTSLVSFLKKLKLMNVLNSTNDAKKKLFTI